MQRTLLAVTTVLIAGGLFVGAQELPTFEPGPKTSYQQVTGYLSPGGNTYIYQNAAQWGATLDALVPPLRNLALMAAGRHGRDEAEVAFHIIEAFLKDSGLRGLNGVGASSIPVGDGLHHSRIYFGHAEGAAKGLLWDAFTQENTPLPLLKALPADTVLATRIPIRGTVVWKWIRKVVASLESEQAKLDFEDGIKDAKREGIEVDKWLASLGDGVALVATLAPKPEGGAQEDPMDLVRRASLAILVEVKDDTIFEALEALYIKPNAPLNGSVKRQDIGEIKALVLQERLPIPLPGPVTLARFGKYLALVSDHRLLKALSESKGGLTDTDEFKRLAAKLPQEGMGFSYLSPRLGDELAGAMPQIKAALGGGRHGLTFMGVVLQSLAQVKGQASYEVSIRTKDGILAMGTGTRPSSKGAAKQFADQFMAQLEVARERAQRISDMSKLKQIGVGITLYSNDFEQRFPDDLGELIDQGYVKPGRAYINPRSNTKPPRSGDQLRAGQCDFLYFGKGLTADNAGAETPIACTKPGMFSGTYINVLYGDLHAQGHVRMPPEVKAAIGRAGKKVAAVGKRDLDYARIRGTKLGQHIARTMPKTRVLLLMPPMLKGDPAAAVLAGLRPALAGKATIVDTVTLAPPKDAKGHGWFTGKLVNEQTVKYQGKVDLVISGMGLPHQGIQSLWFWKSGTKVAIAAGDVSKLRRAIMAKLVIAATAVNPDVVPDDWQPPKDMDAAFAKRYLLLTPDNTQQMFLDHPKLFR